MSDLFTCPDYLQPLEQQGCVDPARGWTPTPITLPSGARAPAYLKTHSWGEFVFDFEIARAYQSHGLDYYPKLVCAVPFTPVPGARLLGQNPDQQQQLIEGLIRTAHSARASSAHVLYPLDDEAEQLARAGWIQRDQIRYVWDQRGYRSFDDFLAALSHKRRKNMRSERRQIAQLGFEIEWHSAHDFSANERAQLYALYASTYHARGQTPYLNAACLNDWMQRFGARMPFCVARKDGRIEAMAFYFVDGARLCGRHWGSASDAALLHFELCYYQGIDYAITHGLQHFDAGVQGEHKLLRGFDACTVPSMHWFAHTDFHRALSAHFARERADVAAHLAMLQRHSAYRSG